MQKSQWFIIFKLFTKTDIVVISLITFSGVAGFLFNHYIDLENKSLTIYKDNILYKTEQLNKTMTIPVDSLLFIEIFDGKARIVHSTCKNLICERMGWSNSKPIICVPNKVHLEFSSQNKEEIFITY